MWVPAILVALHGVKVKIILEIFHFFSPCLLFPLLLSPSASASFFLPLLLHPPFPPLPSLFSSSSLSPPPPPPLHTHTCIGISTNIWWTRWYWTHTLTPKSLKPLIMWAGGESNRTLLCISWCYCNISAYLSLSHSPLTSGNGDRTYIADIGMWLTSVIVRKHFVSSSTWICLPPPSIYKTYPATSSVLLEVKSKDIQNISLLVLKWCWYRGGRGLGTRLAKHHFDLRLQLFIKSAPSVSFSPWTPTQRVAGTDISRTTIFCCRLTMTQGQSAIFHTLPHNLAAILQCLIPIVHSQDFLGSGNGATISTSSFCEWSYLCEYAWPFPQMSQSTQ